MRRFLENPTATAASPTTIVLASSRPVHSAQINDGLLKLGRFGCSCRGVGAANQAMTVGAIVTLLAQAPCATRLVRLSVKLGRSSGKASRAKPVQQRNPIPSPKRFAEISNTTR